MFHKCRFSAPGRPGDHFLLPLLPQRHPHRRIPLPQPLAEVFGTTVRHWPRHGAALLAALDQIEYLGEPSPTLTDSPQRWLPARLARKLPSARLPDFDALYQAMEAGGRLRLRA